jgi:isobutyryl-CoA mutase
MGLQGMINDILQKCDTPPKFSAIDKHIAGLKSRDAKSIAALISFVEDFPDKAKEVHKKIAGLQGKKTIPVLGITGVGGAGKSSLIDEVVRRYLIDFSVKGDMQRAKTLLFLCVDPSKRKTGGALLGDRIRMNAIGNPRVYMRSLATRQSHLALSQSINKAVDILKGCNFDLILLETSGIGQSDTEVVDMFRCVDVCNDT